ncbi:MAG: O-antigen ligase family protein [bacterium]
MTATVSRKSLAAAASANQRLAKEAAAVSGDNTNPFFGVDWSPSYVAFLGYMLAIISYKFPIGAASMAVAILTLPLEKRPLRMPPLAALAFGLVAWGAVCFIGTQYPVEGLTGITEFAKVGAIIFVAVNVLSSRARVRAFLVGTLIVFALFPIRGALITWATPGGTANDGRAIWVFTYSNPNDLASFCLLQVSCCLAILAMERKWWVKLGTQVSLGLLVLLIVLTASRGALIALVATGAILGWKYVRRITVTHVLVMAAMVTLVAVVAPQRVWDRFATLKTATSSDAELFDPDEYDQQRRADQGSSVQRLAIWDVALGIISENPVLGVGLGTYPRAHQVMARRQGYSPIARGLRDTHSTYLNVMAEVGIPGFCIFMGMIVVTLKNARRVRRQMEARYPALSLQLFNAEVGFYGYMVAGIWGSYAAVSQTHIHLVTIYALTELLAQEGGGPKQIKRGKRVQPVAQVAANLSGATA